MDSAEAQGVEVAQSLMQRADAVYRAGRTVSASVDLRQAIAQRGVVVPLEERLEGRYGAARLAPMHGGNDRGAASRAGRG